MDKIAGRGAKHKNHLLIDHKLTVPEYRQHCQSQDWGNPPVTSFKSRKAHAEWQASHPDKVKAQNVRGTAKHKHRRNTEPEFYKNYYEGKRKRKQSKLTDADKAIRVQCPIPGCGEWHQRLDRHLDRVHGISLSKRMAPQLAATLAAPLKAAHWRPKDWWDRPGDYRVIAAELMAKTYMSNKELGKRLDANKIVKCPYGDSWEEALSGPGRAANRISEIRKWIKRPGKTAA
jgi:hypothetical protein